jgi:hypothetical protein
LSPKLCIRRLCACDARRIGPRISFVSTATKIDDQKTLFERWFSNAIDQLEKMENKDGGTNYERRLARERGEQR